MTIPNGYIVACVVRRGSLDYYVAPQETWYLNQLKYDAAFRAKGFTTPPGFDDTFGIAVVDGPEVDKFLKGLQIYRVPEASLQDERRRACAKAAGSELRTLPFILVDFDRRHFATMDFEPLGFEKYLPDGWATSFGDVLSRIPEPRRYW